MSKAYFNDRGAAERAVLYGRTHKDQKPSNDSQIVKLLAQVRDRLADIERERGELVETIQDQDRKLIEIEDRSTSAEKTFISLENRLSRTEMKEAPIVERLDNIERSQNEGGDANTADLRTEILSRIEESDMKTTQMIERIDESMAMQSRMTRRIDKIVQDKQRLNRKLNRLEESMDATRNALASKALLLLGDKDVIARTADMPKIPAFPDISDDDEFLAVPESPARANNNANRIETFEQKPATVTNGAAFMSNGFTSQAITAGVFLVLAIIGGWLISKNINVPPENYAQNQNFAPVLNKNAPPNNFANTNLSGASYLNEDFAKQSEAEIAARLNAIEPSATVTNTQVITAPPVVAAQPVEEAVSAQPSTSTPNIFAADENLPQQFKNLEIEAFKGNAEAQHDLAAMYTAGHGGVAQNFERAAHWFKLASNQGIANARYNLAVLYHQGMGVDQDLGTAINWYEKAADLGHPEAQYNLGIAHIEGIGVEYNPQKAAEYFESAAASGIPESAFNLGLIYENGLMGPAQPNEALIWYKTAADLGNEDAKNAIQSLARSLNIDPNDIERVVEDIQNPAKVSQKQTVSLSPNSAAPDTNQLITQIQQQLGSFGLFPGRADGMFGPLTSDAIRLYQARNDIPVTGQASEELLVHMLTKNLRNGSYTELGSTE